jgi:hypothetical protein
MSPPREVTFSSDLASGQVPTAHWVRARHHCRFAGASRHLPGARVRFVLVPSRIPSILLVAAALLWFAPAAAAATTTVECGQLVAYTPPDPVAPADGSLTIGLLPPWTIAADATLSPEIQANLASVAGSGPSCLVVDRDSGGVITSLDFSSGGSITGAVVYQASLPGEVLADRLLIPTFITDAYPGLAAVFVTSEEAGTSATASLSVDPETGRITAVEATAQFCGAADLAGNGDGLIGAAVLPASVLDATDTKRLAAANGDHGCADVDTTGTIDGSGALSLATQVTISLAAEATPPNTSTVLAPASASAVDSRAAVVTGLAALGILVRTLRRTPRRKG